MRQAANPVAGRDRMDGVGALIDDSGITSVEADTQAVHLPSARGDRTVAQVSPEEVRVNGREDSELVIHCAPEVVFATARRVRNSAREPVANGRSRNPEFPGDFRRGRAGLCELESRVYGALLMHPTLRCG